MMPAIVVGATPNPVILTIALLTAETILTRIYDTLA
jgi:hypothetical protein